MAAVQDFYKNKNFLVTGGTGFLGLSIIEKLLRSFPNIGDIYMVVRTKNHESLDVRREKFINHVIFNQIKEKNPSHEHLFSKLKWIEGQLGLPNLGILPNTITSLQTCINIIIHCAAVLNFNLPLKHYIENNLQSTADLLQFATGCQQFTCFVYVSTSYSQICKSRHFSTEEILKNLTPPRELLKMAAAMTKEEMEEIAADLTKDWVTYYGYSKNVSENLCEEYRDKFPVVIYRPGTIIHSVSEPAPYWINNNMGFLRALMELNRGLVFLSDPDINANSVPVDYATNAVLAIIYQTAIDKAFSIYNFTASSNPISFSKGMEYYRNSLANYEDELVPRRYELISKKNVTPGSAEEKLIKEIQSYKYFQKLIGYYLWNKLQFNNANIEVLWSRMSEDEKHLLPFDVSTIDWRQYYTNMSKFEFGMPKLTLNL